MASERIEIEIVLDDGSVKKGFANIKRQAKATGKNVEKSFRNSEKAVKSLSQSLRSLRGAFIAAIGVEAIRRSLLAFAEFEKQLIAVQKTTDISGEALKQFGREAQRLSGQIPVSTNQLLEFSEAAGQLGIRGSKNLLKFSETMARLQVSTDLAGQAAARSLVRILDITGTSIKEIDKFGAALVGLGNTFAATESEILEVARGVARSTAQFDLSAQEVLGLATALKATGAEAQAASSAVGRTLRLIASALAKGGRELRKFTDILGISAEQLRKDFAENASEVFQLLIKRLGQTNKSSVQLTKSLKDLGIIEERSIKTLAPLIKRYDLLSRATAQANQEFQDNRALLEESDRAFNTLSGRIQRFTNSLQNTIVILSQSPGGLTGGVLDVLTDKINAMNEALAEVDIAKMATVVLLNLKIGAAEFFGDEEGASRLKNLLNIIINDIPEQVKKQTDEANKKIKEQSQIELGGAVNDEALREKIEQRLIAITSARIAAEKTAIQFVRDSRKKQAAITQLAQDELELAQRQHKLNMMKIDEQFGSATLENQKLVNRLREEEQLRFQIQSENITRQAFKGFEERSKQLGAAVSGALASGISSGVQSMVQALRNGTAGFKSFAGVVLGIIGDMAISLGNTLIAIGVGIEALRTSLSTLTGGPAIAAGIALVGVGALLKSFSSGALTSAATGAGPGAVEDQTAFLTGEEVEEQATKVEIDVQGTVLSPRDVGLQIAEILEETFDTNAVEVNTA